MDDRWGYFEKVSSAPIATSGRATGVVEVLTSDIERRKEVRHR